MLLLDKTRALDRMVWLSDRKVNAVPPEFLHPSPLRWTITPGGRRFLAGEAVLCQPSAAQTAFHSPEAPASVEDLGAAAGDVGQYFTNRPSAVL